MIKKLFKLFIFSIILLIVLAYAAFTYLKNNFNLENILTNNFTKNQIVKILDVEDEKDLFDLLPNFLGFSEPKTYLVLFLNDTELRPAGGFIGSYGVIKVDKGKINILKIDGTENLDRESPEDWQITPPDILRQELGVDRWYFRDSNWSPDFSVSAKKALEFYKGEGGLEAEKIDAVFAIDTKVLEEVLKLTGELEVDNLSFNSNNVVEQLEYEVEYGFLEKEQNFTERKNILSDLADKILDNVKIDIFFRLSDYKDLLENMIKEKHILAYMVNPELGDPLKAYEDYDFFGKVKDIGDSEDYLLWVDANLAALKTDWVINRNLNYIIEKNEEGDYIATSKMTYRHNGTFDWRTTRYRTYARIYTPLGSELLSVNSDGDLENLDYEEGIDLDKKYFAYFFVIEPGQTKELEFKYKINDRIVEKIDSGQYTLFVQKQIGTDKPDLTLELNFDKNILSANPAEFEEDWYDKTYLLDTNLLFDREFEINFAK